MTDWKSVLVSPQATIRDALKVINAARSQFAMVVDADGRLLGTLSDGDVRRGLLDNASLEDVVGKCMCREPKVAKSGQSPEDILMLMRRSGLHQIPILDADHRVIGLKTVDDFLCLDNRENPVVIMAGGMGSRLNELTRDQPKPMLPVGGRPLLEMIVNRFVKQGFSRIWLSVNYRAEVIEGYFGDGLGFSAEIRYLREGKRLGTAGALSLLPPKIEQPVIVSNADLVANLDYPELVDAHTSSGAVATMAVREHEYSIPFGVVMESGGWIERIDEKPVHRVVVNAGVYVLSPEAIRRVPQDTYFEMPQLFENLIAERQLVYCHRLNGYWLDIGHRTDYEKANADFSEGTVDGC
jgi:dTDP-glucose pyrophosphorylase